MCALLNQLMPELPAAWRCFQPGVVLIVIEIDSSEDSRDLATEAVMNREPQGISLNHLASMPSRSFSHTHSSRDFLLNRLENHGCTFAEASCGCFPLTTYCNLITKSSPCFPRTRTYRLSSYFSCPDFRGLKSGWSQ